MEHQAFRVSRQVAGLARVALFVDGDNLPASLSPLILDAAERLGRADIRRVYAAEAAIKGWEGALGFRLLRVAGTKNGADMAICIEATETACRDSFDSFVIASNDRDFSHLAHWLRERGLHVLGIGTAKSPESWRAACSSFEVIEAPAVKGLASTRAKAPAPSPAQAPNATSVKASAATSAKAPPATSAKSPQKTVDDPVREFVHGAGRTGIGLGDLASRLGQKGITCASLQAKSWRSYLSRQPERYALDPKGPAARVRWIGA